MSKATEILQAGGIDDQPINELVEEQCYPEAAAQFLVALNKAKGLQFKSVTALALSKLKDYSEEQLQNLASFFGRLSESQMTLEQCDDFKLAFNYAGDFQRDFESLITVLPPNTSSANKLYFFRALFKRGKIDNLEFWLNVLKEHDLLRPDSCKMMWQLLQTYCQSGKDKTDESISQLLDTLKVIDQVANAPDHIKCALEGVSWPSTRQIMKLIQQPKWVDIIHDYEAGTLEGLFQLLDSCLDERRAKLSDFNIDFFPEFLTDHPYPKKALVALKALHKASLLNNETIWLLQRQLLPESFLRCTYADGYVSGAQILEQFSHICNEIFQEEFNDVAARCLAVGSKSCSLADCAKYERLAYLLYRMKQKKSDLVIPEGAEKILDAEKKRAEDSQNDFNSICQAFQKRRGMKMDEEVLSHQVLNSYSRRVMYLSITDEQWQIIDEAQKKLRKLKGASNRQYNRDDFRFFCFTTSQPQGTTDPRLSGAQNRTMIEKPHF